MHLRRVLKAISAWVRFYGIPTGLTCWFGLVVVRLVSLHAGDRLPRNNIRYRSETPAVRGVIYDRGGNPIAVNESGWKIYLDPQAENRKATRKRPAPDPIASCRRVAELCGKSFDSVYTDLYTTNRVVYDAENGSFVTNRPRYVVQGRTFDPSAIDLIENRDLYINNIGLEPILRRIYPQGSRFAHVLGFTTGERLVGQSGGIEQRYDHELRGTDGYVLGVRSCNGPEIRSRRETTVNPIDGASVYLTIDHNIQMVVHDALERAVAEWSAEGGRAIVEKVDTGEILAMVSLPDFDPAEWEDVPPETRKNRTITDQYDPGSTMKAITVAAALNEGIVTPESVYDIGNSPWRYGGGTLRDHATGLIDVQTIIMKSSNIGAAKVALDLGNKTFERYLRAFGFAAQTEIDLPGEARGMLPPSERWEPIKPTRIAIGQGISVTPIQMVNAYATIANGGHRMRPYVMQRVVAKGADGREEVIIRNSPKMVARPIKAETAAKMRKMLTTVVQPGGTGRRARVDGYTVAGKTGTAQMAKPGGGYYDHNHWASFIGFLPADNPVFVVLVLLDNPVKPGKSHDGGVSAAPVFAEIAAATAQYLEIPIDTPQEEQP